MEQTPARDALRSAVNVLAAAATPSTLRDILHRLIDADCGDPRQPLSANNSAAEIIPSGPVPDTTTPPGEPGGVAAAGEHSSLTQDLSGDETPQRAGQPVRRLPVPKATPTRRGKANGKTAGPSLTAEWLHLRKQVRAAMGQRHLDMAGLAAAIDRNRSTVTNVMTKRSAPSAPIANLLREFLLADPGAAEAVDGQHGEAAPQVAPEPVQAPANGHGAVPLEPTALKALKAKRHATPLTQHTLAGQLGLADGELSKALAGEAVSVAAAQRLTAWAAAG